MDIVTSVQARLGSTRLPGKVLFHLGDRRILQWVLDRAEAAESVDRTIAAIGNRPENDAITEYCERQNVEYAVGPEDDLLSRHLNVVEKTNCDCLVRITADCPFVPSSEIDRVIEHHKMNEGRYTTNVTEEMPIGTAVDVLDADLLTELKSQGETHPVKLPRSDPERWDVIQTDNSWWRGVSDAHLAVDTPDDYWPLIDAVHETGDDPRNVAEWLHKRD